MKRLLATVAAIFVACAAQAQVTTPRASAGTGQYALSVSSATSLTVPLGASTIYVCAETQAVRYRDDGVAPTASTGIPIASGSCIWYSGPLSAIQFIAQTGSPTIDVAYYR